MTSVRLISNWSIQAPNGLKDGPKLEKEHKRKRDCVKLVSRLFWQLRAFSSSPLCVYRDLSAEKARSVPFLLNKKRDLRRHHAQDLHCNSVVDRSVSMDACPQNMSKISVCVLVGGMMCEPLRIVDAVPTGRAHDPDSLTVLATESGYVDGFVSCKCHHAETLPSWNCQRRGEEASPNCRGCFGRTLQCPRAHVHCQRILDHFHHFHKKNMKKNPVNLRRFREGVCVALNILLKSGVMQPMRNEMKHQMEVLK